jgi:predicted transposase/invertase (TIGR01784 family)
MEEGELRGLLKGELKGKLDDARAMLADGLPLDKVIKYTGLSVADLESMK